MDNSLANSYEEFIKVFKQRSGLDLQAYKQNQMERRIRSFMHTHQCENFLDFLRRLNDDRTLYDAFFKHLTINVSQFFRDPNQWQTLRRTIIPNFLGEKKSLKIWSAGCSCGQEPYSLAITLLEYFPGVQFKILATDLDDNVLHQAKLGCYPENDFISTPPELRQKYFIRTENGYQISEKVQNLVNFRKQNLLTDLFGSGFDFIVCRNVVIYFTEETKEALYRKFYHSLNNGGILFTGSTEHLFGMTDLGLKTVASFFYQKSLAKTDSLY